jgi:hypothetical protein
MNSFAWAFTALVVCGAAVLCARYFFFTRMRSKISALTPSKEYRALAEEYRRLADMAITANEHVDLRLTSLGVQLDGLKVQLDEQKVQLDQVQRILKEVD